MRRERGAADCIFNSSMYFFSLICVLRSLNSVCQPHSFVSLNFLSLGRRTPIVAQGSGPRRDRAPSGRPVLERRPRVPILERQKAWQRAGGQSPGRQGRQTVLDQGRCGSGEKPHQEEEKNDIMRSVASVFFLLSYGVLFCLFALLMIQ